MKIPFFKYQGTGNDFVMIDNRTLFFPKNDTKLVAKMCDRKFGVGADGLILLENHTEYDFKMVYYNADGNLSSMCGNGGRCLVHMAHHLGIIDINATFEAVDGMHTATVLDSEISLKMNDVDEIQIMEDHVFLDTGSPHHVQLVQELKEYDVQSAGAKIRFEVYGEEGANVNFVERKSDSAFAVRTYERGVEDETLSCGTGVTAVALAMRELDLFTSEEIKLHTPGGNLSVSFTKENNTYKNIHLKGPAMLVFQGVWNQE